jgi:hypothetical protein
MRPLRNVRRWPLVVVELRNLVPGKRAGENKGKIRLLGVVRVVNTVPRAFVIVRVVLHLRGYAINGADGHPFPVANICRTIPRLSSQPAR